MYSSPKFSVALIKKNEMAYCSTYGGTRGSYWDLVRKPKGKEPLGRPRHRWQYTIMMDLQELGCGAWIVDGHLRIRKGP